MKYFLHSTFHFRQGISHAANYYLLLIFNICRDKILVGNHYLYDVRHALQKYTYIVKHRVMCVVYI